MITAAQLPAPFNFYKLMLHSDALHFGYWPQTQPDLSLEQAQHALTDLLLTRFPPAPAQVLDVGCGLGATSAYLSQRGYEVTALAPSAQLIAYAQQHNPGPTYLDCGFLDVHPALEKKAAYDVILLQESLQYIPDLMAVFSKVKTLLKPGGRLVFCDEVSYHLDTRAHSAVHDPVAIEQALGAHGFYVAWHQRIGHNIAPTCAETLRRFEHYRDDLLNADAEHYDHYVRGWRYQEQAYRTKLMGYEAWDVRPSEFIVRGYQEGDENQILPTFNQVFGVARTMAHWHWKYKQNPFGQTFIGSVWQGDNIVAQYAGYPLPLWFEHKLQRTCHGADVFTVPAYRGIGRGQTNLFSRAFRYFSRTHYENKIPFAYGFNTGIPQRLGKLFMAHHFPAPVYQWEISAARLNTLSPWRNKLRGIAIKHQRDIGTWADKIFESAKHDYGALIARTRDYLNWRYTLHPDFDYDFFVVYRWGKPVGWLVGKYSADKFLLGDALFLKNRHTLSAVQAGLNAICRHHHACTTLQAWFSYTPAWWVEILEQTGFKPSRQAQNIDFGVHLVDESISPQDLGKKFYFTWGDSDLF
jgi:SAM-dependent methyltransferase